MRILQKFIQAACIILSLVVFCALPESKGEMMIASKRLTIDERNKYLQGGEKDLDALELRVMKAGVDGLMLIAPLEINVQGEKEFPVVVVSRKTLERGWEVGEDRNLRLVVTHVETGEVQVVSVVQDEKALTHSAGPMGNRPPKPTGANAKGLAVKAYHVNLAKRVRIPWHAGTVTVAAISYDWISNIENVSFVGQDMAPVRTVRSVAPPAGDGKFPNYSQLQESPPLPVSGAAFSISPTTVINESAVVYGSFSIAVPVTAVNQSAVTAVVPVTFIMVGVDWLKPRLFSWWVPASLQTLSVDALGMQGYFAIKLPEEAMHFPPGRYVAYLTLDKGIFGPQLFDLQ